MSHSKEILTVTRWRADDGTTFASQAEAILYEESTKQNEANKKAEKAMRSYIGKQVVELVNYEKQENGVEDSIAKLNVSISGIRGSISQLSSELKRLLNIPKKKSTKDIEDKIDKLNTEIAAQTKLLDVRIEELKGSQEKLDIVQTKMNQFRDGTFAPFLEAWGGYASSDLFKNDYEALKNLVIDNTTVFLSAISQIGEEIGIGSIKLNKDNWWGSEDGRFDGVNGVKRAITIEPK
jgi:uncharacterized coiled-coil protein SlyX